MRIGVTYYARLREAFGVDREEVTVPSGCTAEQLREKLIADGRVELAWEPMRIVRANQVQPWSIQLQPEDEVAFLPPVTGG